MRFLRESIEEYSFTDLHIDDLQSREFCVFDIEATGIDYNNESIIQIGAVKVKNLKIDYSNVFKRFVKPYKKIPSKIETFTGVTNVMVEDAPSLNLVFKEFIDFIGDSVLIAQCGYEFDFPLIKKELERNSLKGYTNYELDTKVMFANIHKDIEETFSTDFMLKYYDIYWRDVQRHDALGDSILIGRILIELLMEYENLGSKSLHIDEELAIKKYVPKSL